MQQLLFPNWILFAGVFLFLKIFNPTRLYLDNIVLFGDCNRHGDMFRRVQLSCKPYLVMASRRGYFCFLLLNSVLVERYGGWRNPTDVAAE